MLLCKEPKEVLIEKRLKNRLPKLQLYDMEPCEKCKGYMKQGVIVIPFDESKTDFEETIKVPNPKFKSPYSTPHEDMMIDTKTPNFYTTGFFVLKDEALQRIADGMEKDGLSDASDIMKKGIEKRVLFIPDGFAKSIGIVTEEE